jgi:RNA polymerase sigma-70 factor, ECF subfamily
MPGSAPDPEAAWIARLRAPDPEERRAAMSEIATAYVPSMIDVAFCVLQDRETASDIAQDISIRFWEQHATITLRCSIRAYLFRGTYNAALNAQREMTSATRWTLADASDRTTAENDALDNLAASDLKHDMDRAIARMPPRRRAVVELAIANYADLQEVADTLGLSLNSVIDHLSKASIDLKRALTHWHSDDTYWPRSNWIHWLANWRHNPSSPPPLQDLTDA